VLDQQLDLFRADAPVHLPEFLETRDLVLQLRAHFATGLRDQGGNPPARYLLRLFD
jgi:hypothetical protein